MQSEQGKKQNQAAPVVDVINQDLYADNTKELDGGANQPAGSEDQSSPNSASLESFDAPTDDVAASDGSAADKGEGSGENAVVADGSSGGTLDTAVKKDDEHTKSTVDAGASSGSGSVQARTRTPGLLYFSSLMAGKVLTNVSEPLERRIDATNLLIEKMNAVVVQQGKKPVEPLGTDNTEDDVKKKVEELTDHILLVLAAHKDLEADEKNIEQYNKENKYLHELEKQMNQLNSPYEEAVYQASIDTQVNYKIPEPDGRSLISRIKDGLGFQPYGITKGSMGSIVYSHTINNCSKGL